MEFQAIAIEDDEDWAVKGKIYRCKQVCNNWGCNIVYYGEDSRWHLFIEDVLKRI